ncbi:MAG TPA: hypothetical protein VEI03_22515 [Stellaceae bacterium]|nr:hypothetical protein [Stellaceae bacterium]
MAHTVKTPASPRRARRRPAARRTDPQSGVERMALVSSRAMTKVEIARVVKALESEGIKNVRPARLILSRRDALRVASGGGTAIRAVLAAEEAQEAGVKQPPRRFLERALRDAKARGDAVRQELLSDPEMLSTAEMAKRLGMSEEGIRLKRRRHEVLGLEFAKRGIRYPSWQVLPDRRLLSGLPRLFSILDGSAWAVYRFLLQSHPELGGARAVDALRRDRIESVIAVAENVATGAFS